jgi:hypothetical protein
LAEWAGGGNICSPAARAINPDSDQVDQNTARRAVRGKLGRRRHPKRRRNMQYRTFDESVSASARRRGTLPRRAGNKYGAGLWLMVLCLACASVVYAQDGGGASTGSTGATAQSTASTVPRLVNFSGVLNDSNGKPITGSVTLTLSLYAEQEGGTPLWTETQNRSTR